MKMKKVFLLLLVAVLALSVTAFAADKSKVVEANAENFATLLIDLAKAYETPTPDDGAAIDADLASKDAVIERQILTRKADFKENAEPAPEAPK